MVDLLEASVPQGVRWSVHSRKLIRECLFWRSSLQERKERNSRVAQRKRSGFKVVLTKPQVTKDIRGGVSEANEPTDRGSHRQIILCHRERTRPLCYKPYPQRSKAVSQPTVTSREGWHLRIIRRQQSTAHGELSPSVLNGNLGRESQHPLLQILISQICSLLLLVSYQFLW